MEIFLSILPFSIIKETIDVAGTDYYYMITSLW